jgi:hypothetical protein
MTYEIDKKIIEQASDCTFGHRCLDELSCSFQCCKVTLCDKGELEIVCKDWTKRCGFRKVPDNSFVCTCPVRKEIYKKYKR